MSDLRFARELGAEFDRLERAGAAEPHRRRFVSWSARLTGRFAFAVALLVPLAIVVLAVALLSLSHDRVRHSPMGTPSGHGLAFSGGNCRTPARTAPVPGHPPTLPGTDGLIRAASGRVGAIAWELRVKEGTETLGGTEHGQLILGGRRYGLCSQASVPVPFGLINDGPHAVVYGYAKGAGSYRITVSAGATPLATSITDTFFFIVTLPHSACSYRALTVTATSTPVAGLPPSISRSLNDAATRLTTTMHFGDCRPQALVTAIAEDGRAEGRSPNAPLANGIAQLSLIPPPGSHSKAGGTVWELSHDGHIGINLLAVRLTPGRYGIWLLGPHDQVTQLAAVTVTHELQGAYDLPAAASSGSQLVISTQAPGQTHAPGRVVLRATFP